MVYLLIDPNYCRNADFMFRHQFRGSAKAIRKPLQPKGLLCGRDAGSSAK
jgi:hypothetical protein